MKALACISVLVLLRPAIAQEKIENWSHPFQVLFTENATYIGQQKPVSPFDFVSKYDLILNNGTLTLLHYTGEIRIITSKTVNIRELAKSMDVGAYVERPIISNPQLFTNLSINHAYRDTMRTVYTCGTSALEIVYPDTFDSGHIYTDSEKDHLHLIWESTNPSAVFEVILVDVFDELILKTETSDTQMKIPRTRFSKSKVPILEIKTKDGTASSGHYAIEFRKLDTKTSYEVLLVALEEQWIGNVYVAQKYFKKAVKVSSNDHRFLELYRQFIDRNPTLESALVE